MKKDFLCKFLFHRSLMIAKILDNSLFHLQSERYNAFNQLIRDQISAKLIGGFDRSKIKCIET